MAVWGENLLISKACLAPMRKSGLPADVVLGLGCCWGADKDSEESQAGRLSSAATTRRTVPISRALSFSTVRSHQNSLPLLDYPYGAGADGCGHCCSKPLQQQVTRASMAPGKKKAESVGQVYAGRQTNSILEERQSRTYEHLLMYKPSGPAISVLVIYTKSGHTQGRYPLFGRAKSSGHGLSCERGAAL